VTRRDPPRRLRLTLLDATLAVCRLDPRAPGPAWTEDSSFVSLTRTAEELSVVCEERCVPSGVTAERGWRALKLEGPIPFTETGVLEALARPLAEAGIGIFALSTYDTDYVLVKEADLDAAVGALTGAGHEIAG